MQPAQHLGVPAYSKRVQQRLLKFGSAVRAARLLANLSQEELAERSGLHRTYVGGVERGERNISLANIFALADALETRATTLLAQAD